MNSLGALRVLLFKSSPVFSTGTAVYSPILGATIMRLMARPFLIIDGYNLMHAAGMTGRRYGPGQFEKSRNRFLRFLATHLGASERRRTVVVFDAQSAELGQTRVAPFEEMEILFSSGRDADDLIEEIIAAHSSPKQILLVSSDHRLQKAARRRRAKSVDSEEFVAELERHGPTAHEPPRPASTNNPKYSGQISPEELDMWMREFGEVPQEVDAPHVAPIDEPRDPSGSDRGDISNPDFWGIDVKKLRDELD